MTPPEPEAAEEALGPLATGYYLDNFEALLASVVAGCDFLDEAEAAFCEGFPGLGLGARRLYVRLISRRGPCFRRDLIDYPEVGDLDAALLDLIEAGFLDLGEDAALDELLRLLRVDELRSLAQALGIATPKRRTAILEALESVEPELVSEGFRQGWVIVRPLCGAVVRRLQILFFGNGHQDLSDFVLQQIGRVRYEEYPLRQADGPFPDRHSFETALTLMEAREHQWLLVEAGQGEVAVELAEAVAAGIEEYSGEARRRADGIVNESARWLERAGRSEEAIALYCRAWHPPARERRARILEKQGELGGCIELCEAMEAEPRDESERVAAPTIGRRARKRRGESLGPQRRFRPKTRELVLPRREGEVELAVLEALEVDGWQGVHGENALWRSLFGLAFWDLIFAPLPGAFAHPYQSGPLDLRRPEFRERREPGFRERLAEVAAGDFSALRRTMREKRGIACSLLSWDFEERVFEAALACIPGAGLAAVFDRLSRDIRRYGRGFPDLFVWREEDFELLEVKGPGDQLRPEQRGWLAHMEAAGLPAIVQRVSWQD